MSKQIFYFTLLFLFVILIANSTAYEIGHTSVTYYDAARDRDIPTEILYPAEEEGDDVPMAEPEGDGFPVVSFGHGRMSNWEDNENIWTALVPEGFIVAFPCTELGWWPNHLQFGLDMAFVITAIKDEGSDPESMFYEKVGETSAVMGHSMGGGASFLAAQSDNSITAISNMSAGETNPSAIEAAEDVTAPALIFAGSDDYLTPPEDFQIPMYESLSSDCKTLIIITGASHCQFVGYNYWCQQMEDNYPPPGLTREEQQAITNEFMVRWFKAILQNDVEAWYEYEDLLFSSEDITYMYQCDSLAVGINSEQVMSPSVFDLSNYPNPFNPECTITYKLTHPTDVSLEIYDVYGNLIKSFQKQYTISGYHSIIWDGKDNNGNEAPSGVYFYQLKSKDFFITKKMILLR